MKNVAADPNYKAIADKLRKQLMDELKSSGDPRLVDDGKFVYMKTQQFDAEGDRIDIDIPTRASREQKGQTAHLFCPTGFLDDTWFHHGSFAL